MNASQKEREREREDNKERKRKKQRKKEKVEKMRELIIKLWKVGNNTGKNQEWVVASVGESYGRKYD